MFALLGNLSNKQILDAVLQLPDVKIVPPISKRYGIFIIKYYSNSPKLKLPGDIHKLIEANTGKITHTNQYSRPANFVDSKQTDKIHRRIVLFTHLILQQIWPRRTYHTYCSNVLPGYPTKTGTSVTVF